MVTVIVVMPSEKKPEDYERAKNPATLHRKNYVTMGTLKGVDPSVVEDLRRGDVDPDLVDRIHEEMYVFDGYVDLHMKKHGAKYGGFELVYKDLEV